MIAENNHRKRMLDFYLYHHCRDTAQDSSFLLAIDASDCRWRMLVSPEKQGFCQDWEFVISEKI